MYITDICAIFPSLTIRPFMCTSFFRKVPSLKNNKIPIFSTGIYSLWIFFSKLSKIREKSKTQKSCMINCSLYILNQHPVQRIFLIQYRNDIKQYYIFTVTIFIGKQIILSRNYNYYRKSAEITPFQWNRSCHLKNDDDHKTYTLFFYKLVFENFFNEIHKNRNDFDRLRHLTTLIQ